MRPTILFHADVPDTLPASLWMAFANLAGALNRYHDGQLDSEFVLPSSSLPKLTPAPGSESAHPTDPCPPPTLELEDDDGTDGMPDWLELREPPLEQGFDAFLEVGSEVDFNGVDYTIYSCSLDGLTVYVKTSTL